MGQVMESGAPFRIDDLDPDTRSIAEAAAAAAGISIEEWIDRVILQRPPPVAPPLQTEPADARVVDRAAESVHPSGPEEPLETVVLEPGAPSPDTVSAQTATTETTAPETTQPAAAPDWGSGMESGFTEPLRPQAETHVIGTPPVEAPSAPMGEPYSAHPEARSATAATSPEPPPTTLDDTVITPAERGYTASAEEAPTGEEDPLSEQAVLNALEVLADRVDATERNLEDILSPLQQAVQNLEEQLDTLDRDYAQAEDSETSEGAPAAEPETEYVQPEREQDVPSAAPEPEPAQSVTEPIPEETSAATTPESSAIVTEPEPVHEPVVEFPAPPETAPETIAEPETPAAESREPAEARPTDRDGPQLFSASLDAAAQPEVTAQLAPDITAPSGVSVPLPDQDELPEPAETLSPETDPAKKDWPYEEPLDEALELGEPIAPELDIERPAPPPVDLTRSGPSSQAMRLVVLAVVFLAITASGAWVFLWYNQDTDVVEEVMKIVEDPTLLTDEANLTGAGRGDESTVVIAPPTPEVNPAEQQTQPGAAPAPATSGTTEITPSPTATADEPEAPMSQDTKGAESGTPAEDPVTASATDLGTAPQPTQQPAQTEQPPNPPASAQVAVGTEAPASDDLAQTVKWLQDAALRGNSSAQHDLGILYAQGSGVEQDYRKAAHWFREAALNGVANAQYNLGVLYEQGLGGVPKDPLEALLWYLSAAEQNHRSAQYNVGVAYAEGKDAEGNGIPQNFIEARKWFIKAAERGLAKAQYNLGVLYEEGQGTIVDMTEAYRWYSIAAANGEIDAEERLRAIETRLSSEELNRATELAKQFVAKAAKTPSSRFQAAADASPDVIAAIQRLLTRLNFDPGPADGIPGQRTINAIREYQKASGLDVDGNPSATLLAHLQQILGE